MAEADFMPIEAAAEDAYQRNTGQKLRAAREAMGLTLADICAITKINQRHLAAVEEGNFAALPARIYVVGFARSFATAVGLDGPAIAAEIRRELDGAQSRPALRPYDQDLEDPAKVPSKRLAWIAVVLGIGLIAAGTVFWRSYYVPALDLPPVREGQAADPAFAEPQLSPAAMVSPTAESAAGLGTALDPATTAQGSGSSAGAPAAPSAPAAQRPAPGASAPASAVQSPPATVPQQLEPLPAPAPAAAAPGPGASAPSG